MAPGHTPLIEIDISTPQSGSPALTPPVSPLERMSASASEVSAGLLDLANVMVSRVASEVTDVSEDLTISESVASEFELLQSHHLQPKQPAA